MGYSTQRITTDLLSEVKRALHKVSFGSIEIIVQDSVVTQITVRNIKKTSYKLTNADRENDNSSEDKKKNIFKRNGFSSYNSSAKIKVLTIKK